MDKVRVGVVGCGVIANQTYLPGIVGFAAAAELVAVCDAQRELAERAAQRFGAREVYGDYAEMLTRAPIDAVVVLTNIQSHAANVLAGLQAGKHVYTEKTMATSLEEADRCIAEAARRNLLLTCAPPVMLNATNQRVKDLLARGAIGRVNFVRARHSHGGPAASRNWTADPTWFYKPGAGPILDLGVYAFHELTGILGPVRRVTAMAGIAMPVRPIRSGPAKGGTIQVETNDNALTLLDFGDATFAVVDSTYCVPAAKGPRTEYYGSEGTLNVNDRWSSEPPLELYRDDERLDVRGWLPIQMEGASRWSLASGVGHLVDCIREGRRPIISAEHARHCLEVMLMSMEAARTGATQEVRSTF
jgi:predicted dehydrogenase